MKQELKQTIFLISMIVFIIMVLFMIVFLIKNKDLLKANPIEYGIKMYNFTHCTCYTEEKFVTFPLNYSFVTGGEDEWGKLKF